MTDYLPIIVTKNKRYVDNYSQKCITKSLTQVWNMHHDGDILNSSSWHFVNHVCCFTQYCDVFQLLGNAQYSRRISCGYHTLFCWIKISRFLIQSNSPCVLQGMLYAVLWIRLSFVIWYLISLMNLRDLLRGLNRSFVCLFVNYTNS